MVQVSVFEKIENDGKKCQNNDKKIFIVELAKIK